MLAKVPTSTLYTRVEGLRCQVSSNAASDSAASSSERELFECPWAADVRMSVGRAHGAQPMAARSGPITNVKIAGSVQQCTVYLLDLARSKCLQ